MKLLFFIILTSLYSFGLDYNTYDYPKKEIKTNIIKNNNIKIQNINYNEGSFDKNQNNRNGKYLLYKQDWKHNSDYTQFLVKLTFVKQDELSQNKDNLFTMEKELQIYFKDNLLMLKIDGIQKNFELDLQSIKNLKNYNDSVEYVNSKVFIEKQFTINNYIFDLIFF